MRPIDADALIKKWENVHSKDTTFAMAIIGAINDVKKAPTIDAVLVIRCKDCKWYEFDRKMHCGLPHGVRSKDDYCSDAERKEE